MRQEAIILIENELTRNDRNVSKLLDFFAIAYRNQSYGQLLGIKGKVPDRGYHMLTSATTLSRAIENLGGPSGWQTLMKDCNSLFVYGMDDSLESNSLIRYFTKDEHSKVIGHDPSAARLEISSDYPDMCGPMSGLQFPAPSRNTEYYFRITSAGREYKRLIYSGDRVYFLKLNDGGTDIYLNVGNDVVDVDEQVNKGYFDIRDYFQCAVPLTMYLLHSFREVRWKKNEILGCVIVDDPNLKPRYGYFDFKKTLDFMTQHNFTTNISFIPWNYKSAHPRVVEMLKMHADRYSLSVHGCDHTANEFGSSDILQLNNKIKLAQQRMNYQKAMFGCHHDEIMIFPQGVFSPESLKVLKYSNFVAAVNTEVSPGSGTDNMTTIRDTWDVAIMKYSSFPLLMRRYTSHGIENFAFDMLLEKPCILVTHHDNYKNDAAELLEFIQRLNSLDCSIAWRRLGEVVRQSIKQRTDEAGNHVIKFYANQATINNTTRNNMNCICIKEETEPGAIQSVSVNRQKVRWNTSNNYIHFELSLKPGDDYEVCVEYNDIYGAGKRTFDMAYTLTCASRRHLSVARDNLAPWKDFFYSLFT